MTERNPLTDPRHPSGRALTDLEMLAVTKSGGKWYPNNLPPYADVLVTLATKGVNGTIEDTSGKAAGKLQAACSLDYTKMMGGGAFTAMLSRLDDAGWIARNINGKRTLGITLLREVPEDALTYAVIEPKQRANMGSTTRPGPALRDGAPTPEPGAVAGAFVPVAGSCPIHGPQRTTGTTCPVCDGVLRPIPPPPALTPAPTPPLELLHDETTEPVDVPEVEVREVAIERAVERVVERHMSHLDAEVLGARPGRLAARIEASLPPMVEAAAEAAVNRAFDAIIGRVGAVFGFTGHAERVEELEHQLEEVQAARRDATAAHSREVERLAEEVAQLRPLIDYYAEREDELLRGTNNGQRASRDGITPNQVPQQLKRLAEHAIEQGVVIYKTRGGHLEWVVKQEDGTTKSTFSASTPSKGATEKVMLRKLRKLGVPDYRGNVGEMADEDRYDTRRGSVSDSA